MLEANQLACVRGDRPLFTGISFRLAAGHALNVAGANGAGKTSLLRILCGLSAPAEGEVRWKGERIGRLREEFFRDLIYVGHAAAVKDDLSALENLSTAAHIAGSPIGEAQALAALAAMGLAGREDLPARVLSQGQRRRVVLARLLLAARPTLWVLDEPFNALDRQAVGHLQRTMDDHLNAGGMLIYTTHQEISVGSGATTRLDLDRDGRPC